MKASGYRLVRLKSGACSIHSLAHKETFHPVIGPVAEAEALYVRQLGLVDRLRQHTGEFVIWDVGLGAAANVLTVLRAGRTCASRLRVVSFDRTLEPLRYALEHVDALDYLKGYEEPAGRLAGGERTVEFLNGGQPVTWTVEVDDFPSMLARMVSGESHRDSVSAERCHSFEEPSAAHCRSAPVPKLGPARGALPPPHVILFDAFSPATNPEMWTRPLFTNLYRCLDPARPCAMPTYSRSTMLRVTLLLAGFCVGTGQATGEKEETTIAANTVELIEAPLERLWLAQARRSTSAEPLHEPVYRQAPLRPETWEQLQAHPQFR